MIDDLGLFKALNRGYPVTLVLGAGVSRARGLPLWPELLRAAWELVMGNDPYASDCELLERSRDACRAAGISPDFVRRLDLTRHPLELQFAFECIFDRLLWSETRHALRGKLKLRGQAKQDGMANEQLAADAFAALLRKILYKGQQGPLQSNIRATDTLSLVARAIRRSALAVGGRRVVSQVITFNVDDLLEQVVNANHRKQLAFPVTRAADVSHFTRRSCLSIYHLHGFVPQHPSRYPFRTWDGGEIIKARLLVESLVFSDEQYWRTVANPAGFASRTFVHALSGVCVFIGLSMTDLNIIRWLAQYAAEAKHEFRLMAAEWKDADEVEFDGREELSRHFWITDQKADEPSEEITSDFGVYVLRQLLGLRGVQVIEIPSWTSKAFHELWRAGFLS